MPLSTEHKQLQDSCSIQLCCSLIDQTVPSTTREHTVVASATTKQVKENDTHIGRNSKRNQQKYTYTCVWIAQDTTESRSQ